MSKNVVDLELFKESLQEESQEKRDGKNVIDLKQFEASTQQDQDEKREAKNVYNLQALKEGLDTENEKREAKNVYNLQALKEGLEVENEKTETRNDKRSIQHVFDIEGQNVHQNLLQSILPQLQSITVFTGYIRDDLSLAKKTADSSQSMIIIAPSDDAISNKLNNLKPWEFPTELTGNSDDDKIVRENLKNFLSGHVIVDFKDKFVTNNDEIIANLINGNQVKIKQEGVDKFKISTGNDWIKIEIVKQVDNGYIFVINDVLVKP
ncbi:FAS1 domain-containing protein [Debaryomyces fabryi]|uniref:FAS1 domain-containing protein n=1 Tax=Debaryomyces fabryi TaxID=58627 RepID=A0A0V1Q140_9ASCO|nr:FAS1 domain-containing protein [Debaryomyces fabryi]KSA02219.1 FAS1 domain-containing protein [Debaryomyces fabryi]